MTIYVDANNIVTGVILVPGGNITGTWNDATQTITFGFTQVIGPILPKGITPDFNNLTLTGVLLQLPPNAVGVPNNPGAYYTYMLSGPYSEQHFQIPPTPPWPPQGKTSGNWVGFFPFNPPFE